ncbi:Protein of unknown function [Bacillus mycoides]|jgi:hypothetical protein
MSLFN